MEANEPCYFDFSLLGLPKGECALATLIFLSFALYKIAKLQMPLSLLLY